MSYSVYTKDHGKIAGGFRTLREAQHSAEHNGQAYFITRVRETICLVRDNNKFVAPRGGHW